MIAQILCQNVLKMLLLVTKKQKFIKKVKFYLTFLKKSAIIALTKGENLLKFNTKDKLNSFAKKQMAIK